MLPGNEEHKGGNDEPTGGEVATENTEPATDHTDHADHGDETPEHDAAAVDETLKQGADMHAGAAGKTGGFSDDVRHDADEEPMEMDPVLRMLKGLSDGTISREEGRAFIAEHYPELND